MAVFPIVIFFLYPETKGVPLEAVDYLFEVPAWRARPYAMAKYQKEYQNRIYLQAYRGTIGKTFRLDPTYGFDTFTFYFIFILNRDYEISA